MNNLLPDASVYRKVTKGEGMMEAAKFKKARGMILQLARGKGYFTCSSLQILVGAYTK